jgi:hypothetical protein
LDFYPYRHCFPGEGCPVKKEMFGSSASYGDHILKYQLETLKPSTIVDFGAGGGKNGIIARQILSNKVKITAVEGFEITSQMLSREKWYDNVCCSLIQEWIYRDKKSYDLAIFGDVLEHLNPKEIHATIRRCLKKFKSIIIICPLYDIFQDEIYGNPLEVHAAYLTEGFFKNYNIIEKHVIRGMDYTIMNILIRSDNSEPLYRKISWNVFHFTMLLLQPLGCSRKFVNLLKRYGKKIRWLLRD